MENKTLVQAMDYYILCLERRKKSKEAFFNPLQAREVVIKGRAYAADVDPELAYKRYCQTGQETNPLLITNVRIDDIRLIIEYCLEVRRVSNSTTQKFMNTIVSAMRRCIEEMDALHPDCIKTNASVVNIHRALKIYAKNDKYGTVNNEDAALDDEEAKRLMAIDVFYRHPITNNTFKRYESARYNSCLRFLQLALVTGLRFDDLVNLKIKNVTYDTKGYYVLTTVQAKTKERIKMQVVDAMTDRISDFIEQAKVEHKVRTINPKTQGRELDYTDRSLFDIIMCKQKNKFTKSAKVAIMQLVCRKGYVTKVSRSGEEVIYTDIERAEYFSNAHKLRHSLGMQLMYQGASLSEVANQLGHKSVQTTTIYARMVSNDKVSRANAIKLNELYEG
jgi:integrase